VGIILPVLVWAYWPVLSSLVQNWTYRPEYSHGYLVPFFAGVLLWMRRDHLTPGALQPSSWGIAFLAVGTLLYLAGGILFIEWLDAVSFLACLAGLSMLVGGWPVLSWTWPGIAFLMFMVPMPYTASTALAAPLQRLATSMSTYALQTVGLPAVAEGNVIVIDEARFAVEEACSGLSMLVTFVALSTAVAIVVRRPWPDRLAIVVSAVPLAILMNVTRITVTGILHRTAGPRVAHAVFHDWAGWFMMPLAVALLMVLMRVLSRLFVTVPDVAPLSEAHLRRPARVAARGAPSG
jgi:exosortase